MEKRTYEYEGIVYSVDKGLHDKWLEREGIQYDGSCDEAKYKDAMECVIVNAKGRLELQGINRTKDAVEHAMEEIIREEIKLTGGEA